MKVKGRPKAAPFMFIICLLGSFSFVLGQNPDPQPPAGPRKPVDVDAVREYVEKTGNTDMNKFTYDQFKPWEYPRVFPFCVTRNQIMQGNPTFKEQSKENLAKPLRVPENSHLFKFERMFQYEELRNKKYYQFEPEKDSIIHNKTFVKAIEFSRINTPEPDMINLRQWVHIKVEMIEKMQGLYLQSIVGPFGLPFGEFSVEFPCKDDLLNTGDIDKVGQLAYCSYRPRTNIYHPSVYVGVDKNGRDQFHVHFKWFDLACMETPYVQFLMMIVKEFKTNPTYGIDFVTQLSPVFLNTNFDSKDGSPYPYYPGFRDNMFCFLKSNTELANEYKKIPKYFSTRSGGKNKAYEKIAWVPANVTRIQANEEYDDCILYDSSKPTDRNRSIFKQDEASYECGPGPLRCNKDYSTLAKELKITEFRTDMVSNETKVENCFPCGVPACEKIGFNPELCNIELPEINDLTAETESLVKLDDNFRIRNHGVGGMLSFLFLIPVGNFIGRFYKEILGRTLFGNGPWISIHIMCHLLSIAAIWSSFGPMVPTLAGYRARRRTCIKLYNTTQGDDYEYCMKDYVIKTKHSVIGLIAYILVHFAPVFGFIRPTSNKMRYIMSSIHASLGYLTYVLGVLAIYFGLRGENKCIDTKIFATVMIILPIIFSIVLVVLDNMSDKLIGVTPARKQFPVLEQLQLESVGPFTLPKLIVLAVFIGVMTITWLLALLSLHIISGSGDKLVDGGQSFKDGKGKFLKGLQGLFGNCT